jgi:hypothetical protein
MRNVVSCLQDTVVMQSTNPPHAEPVEARTALMQSTRTPKLLARREEFEGSAMQGEGASAGAPHAIKHRVGTPQASG